MVSSCSLFFLSCPSTYSTDSFTSLKFNTKNQNILILMSVSRNVYLQHLFTSSQCNNRLSASQKCPFNRILLLLLLLLPILVTSKHHMLFTLIFFFLALSASSHKNLCTLQCNRIISCLLKLHLLTFSLSPLLSIFSITCFLSFI